MLHNTSDTVASAS